MTTVTRKPRQWRKALVRRARRTGSPIVLGRAQIVATAAGGRSPAEVAEMLACARSQVYRTLSDYEAEGWLGLLDGRASNGVRKVDDSFLRVRTRLEGMTIEFLEAHITPDTQGRLAPVEVIGRVHRTQWVRRDDAAERAGRSDALERAAGGRGARQGRRRRTALRSGGRPLRGGRQRARRERPPARHPPLVRRRGRGEGRGARRMRRDGSGSRRARRRGLGVRARWDEASRCAECVHFRGGRRRRDETSATDHRIDCSLISP